MRKEKSELARKQARVTPNSDSGRARAFPAPKGGSALPRLRLRVTASAESKLRSGHPWLFAESIREQNREGQLGELAVVYDRNNRLLAMGLFDPDSPLRVRVLHLCKPVAIDRAWRRERLLQVIPLLEALFDEQT